MLRCSSNMKDLLLKLFDNCLKQCIYSWNMSLMTVLHKKGDCQEHWTGFVVYSPRDRITRSKPIRHFKEMIVHAKAFDTLYWTAGAFIWVRCQIK